MQDLNKIFLGHTPSDQRTFLRGVLSHVRDRFPVIHLPAIGMFTLAEMKLSPAELADLVDVETKLAKLRRLVYGDGI